MDFNNAIQEFITKAVHFIPNLIAAIVIFILTLMISSFVVSALKKVLQAHQVDEELIVLLSRI
ncbi:MAG: hypothetical protein SVR94_08040, partial [Pseudomonadota bacterium]|nr:hypothetical protein [Pseudomonadota bacterium]